MRILVIGHHGYVGSGLFAFFKKENGIEVLGLSSDDGMQNLSVDMIINMGISLVVNCAAVTCRTNRSYQLNSPTDYANFLYLRKLIETVTHSEIPLIQISTKDVYGLVYTSENITLLKERYHPNFFVDESFKFSPETIYAKSKLIGEYLVEHCSRYVVIRLNTIYTSIHHKNGGWILQMCNSILDNKNISLANSGLIFRDPLHVDDLGTLILKIYKSNLWNIKMNVGGGAENLVGIKEVFDTIIESIPKTKEYTGTVSVCNSSDYGFAFSNEYAKKLFNWMPQKILRDELVNLINIRIKN
jgi:nucleoside-diphosphate-sugar epimerase